MEIKVGILVSYDHEFIYKSLPPIYKRADKIVLAIDKKRKTYTGKDFNIPDSFFSYLKNVDLDNKIEIYEDDFYMPGLTIMESEVRERNMLANYLGKGGWHFQIDIDEYFIDFEGFVREILSLEDKYAHKNISVRVFWKTIFKISNAGMYLIGGIPESSAAIATNNPVYVNTRDNFQNTYIQSSYQILHQSWGRNEEDLLLKLNSWGHSQDFDTNALFNFWKSIEPYNYKFMKNFHPFTPWHWGNLELFPAKSIEELIKQLPAQIENKKNSPLTRFQKWIPPLIFDALNKALVKN